MNKSDFFLIMAMLFFISSSVNNHSIPLVIVSGLYTLLFVIATILESKNNKNK